MKKNPKDCNYYADMEYKQVWQSFVRMLQNPKKTDFFVLISSLLGWIFLSLQIILMIYAFF